MNDENAPNCPCGRDHAGDPATKFHAPEKYLVVRSLLGVYTVGKTMMYPGTEDVRGQIDPVMSGFMASIAVPDTPEGIEDIPTGRGPAPDGTPFGAFVTGTMNANDGPVMIATVHIGDGRWVTSVLDLPAMVGSWVHSMIGPELWG